MRTNIICPEICPMVKLLTFLKFIKSANYRQQIKFNLPVTYLHTLLYIQI